MKQKWELQLVGDGIGFVLLRLVPLNGGDFINLTSWLSLDDWKAL